MTGLLWAEVRRFGVRPAIRWIAAVMLLHVVLVVTLQAFDTDSSTLATAIEQGAVSVHALGSVALAMVAGVLLVTGEAASGGTRALLTLEPRRGRVYWSKVAAAALAVVPGVAVAYALLASGTYAVHARAGLLGGTPSDLAPALTWSGVRVLALAVCAAAVGAALGLLVQRWWVAVALVVAWSLAEGVVLGATSTAPGRLLVPSADAWVRGAGPAGSAEGILEAPLVQSAVVLLGVTAALTLLGAAVFRRRDV